MIKIEGKQVVTVRDAAKIAGVTVDCIHKWIQSGVLVPETRIGYLYVMTPKAVQETAASLRKTKPRISEKTLAN